VLSNQKSEEISCPGRRRGEGFPPIESLNGPGLGGTLPAQPTLRTATFSESHSFQGNPNVTHLSPKKLNPFFTNLIFPQNSQTVFFSSRSSRFSWLSSFISFDFLALPRHHLSPKSHLISLSTFLQESLLSFPDVVPTKTDVQDDNVLINI